MRIGFGYSLAAILLLSGCSSQGAKIPPVFPVQGKVTYNGSPVAEASVSLSPVNPGPESAGGFGLTDAKGEFNILAFPPKQGVPQGKYIATIVKASPVPDVAATLNIPAGLPAHEVEAQIAEAKERASSAVTAKPAPLVPLKYSSKETSGLEVEVTSAGKTDIVWDLVD